MLYSFISYSKTCKQSSSCVLDDRFIHYVIYYIGLYIEITRKTVYCSENISYPNTTLPLTIQSSEKWSDRHGHFLMGEICSKIQAIIVVFERSNRLFFSFLFFSFLLNNQPDPAVCSQFYSTARLLYMFREFYTPIIMSTISTVSTASGTNLSIVSATFFQRGLVPGNAGRR